MSFGSPNAGGSRRALLALLVVGALVAAAVAALALGLFGDSEARSQLDRFLGDWEVERFDAAAALTNGRSQAVADALAANRDGLDGAALAAEVEDFEQDGGTARATVAMEWSVPGIDPWGYSTTIELEEGDDNWLVRWDETVVHPDLQAGQRLGTVREFPERAPILDRDGEALVEERPVVDVNMVAGRADDGAVEPVVEATEADRRTVSGALRRADRGTLITAITLREEEFEAIEAELQGLRGVQFSERRQPLAPTRGFARALLGTVSPATAEQLRELGPAYVPGDQAGQWGLEAAFEGRLAGTPTVEVVIRRDDGAPVETLHEVPWREGEPLRTTLDAEVQQAAEDALGLRERRAALVAVEPSSGDLLAVANRPVEDSFNRAFEGQYPPGSTFKVVTTAALLESGLDPGETVDCPSSLDVGGREFVNFEGGARGSIPFRLDFAYSCNTAFVSLSDRLSPEALPEAAERFGIGAGYELPLPAFSGEVPAAEDPTERPAAMIGQGEVLASPLALAGVAATVADGRWRAPRLLAEQEHQAGPRLPAGEAEELRELMRLVVTTGTGEALRTVPGPVAGKSGTAEFGTGDPPRTHAWFIAFRGDLAVSVLVEGGSSGGEVAAPIAADFLEQLTR